MTGGKRDSASASSPGSRSAWLSWPAWTGIGSLAAVVALAVALVAWWWPQSPASDPALNNPALNDSAPDIPATSKETDVVAGAPRRQYLYQLPVNQAGQLGQQREPLDVELAGNHYRNSTGIWTSCAGGTVPNVTFYPGRSYRHLAGSLGIVQSAPDDMAVTVLLYADGSVLKSFSVNRDQVLPIDVDISGFTKIEIMSFTYRQCPHTGKPSVFLGDALVF